MYLLLFKESSNCVFHRFDFSKYFFSTSVRVSSSKQTRKQNIKRGHRMYRVVCRRVVLCAAVERGAGAQCEVAH